MCHAPAGGERERLLSHVKKINFRFPPADHSVHTIFFCLPRDGQFLFFAVFLLCRLLRFLGASNISVDLSKSQEMPKKPMIFEEILRFPPSS